MSNIVHNINKYEKYSLPDEEQKLVFQNVVHRITNVTQPYAIICFGSFARNKVHARSDIDLAIIFKSNEELKAEKKKILNSKLFLDLNVDLLFYTLDDFLHKATIGGVCVEIAQEGIVIYGKKPGI